MLFEARVIYEKEDIWALMKGLETRRCKGRPLKRAMRVLGTFVAVHFLLLFLTSMILNVLSIKVTSWTFVVWFALFTFALTLYDQWGNQQRFLSWVTWRRYRDKGTDLQYEFFENEFTVHSSDADSRYDYSVIQDIVEGPNHYLLVVDINMAHVLNKKSFLAGDSNAFGPWISQKTGKKMIRMH